MDKILIKNACFSVHVGVDDEERSKLQNLLIDATLYGDVARSATTDDIADTINYAEVCTCIAIVLEQEHRLIEAIAEQVAKRILSTFPIQTVKIRIKKPRALYRADYAGVEIVRDG